jgi:serine/threonine protein kinase
LEIERIIEVAKSMQNPAIQFGTKEYLPPETAFPLFIPNGKNDFDPFGHVMNIELLDKVDIWSLGVTLFVMLTVIICFDL